MRSTGTSRCTTLPTDADEEDAVLRAYAAAQGEHASALRERPQGTPPWPDANNPMLAHLMKEALRMAADDPKGAVVWLAVHCFFEGGIDAVAHADELGLHSTSGRDTTAT